MQIGFGAGILQRAGVPYDIDASNYFSMISARGGSISTDRKVLVNKFIKDLKSDLGISRLSDAFDVLYLFAHENQIAALTNLVKDAHHGVAYNSPTFTTDRGFTGNGTSAYINTQYNPSTQSVNYTQNNASIGVYARTTGTRGRVLAGAYESPFITGVYSANAGTFFSALNDTSSATPDGGTRTTTGLITLSRDNSANYVANFAGSSIGSLTAVSGRLVNLNIAVLALRINPTTLSTYSDAQIAVFFAAKSFINTENLKLNNTVEWFLDRIGAGVQ